MSKKELIRIMYGELRGKDRSVNNALAAGDDDDWTIRVLAEALLVEKCSEEELYWVPAHKVIVAFDATVKGTIVAGTVAYKKHRIPVSFDLNDC